MARVVTARNPVHSVLFLVLAFVSAAAIWLLLQAEFLAIVLVLVYVGAVMVLFLFVVMMLDINVDQVRHGFWKTRRSRCFVGAAIVIELSIVTLGAVRSGRVGRCARAAAQLQQHRRARAPSVHRLRLPAGDRRRDPAGGDGGGDRAHLRRRKDAKGQTPGPQVRVQGRATACASSIWIRSASAAPPGPGPASGANASAIAGAATGAIVGTMAGASTGVPDRSALPALQTRPRHGPQHSPRRPSDMNSYLTSASPTTSLSARSSSRSAWSAYSSTGATSSSS